MSNTLPTEKAITNALEAMLKSKVSKAMEIEIEKAKKNIDDSLRNEIAGFTLGLLKMYSVERRGEDIVITVRNIT